MQRFLLLILIIPTLLYPQKSITLYDMRARYKEFAQGIPIDSTIGRDADEVILSSYRWYQKGRRKYYNPRKESPAEYSYDLVSNLRTPQYPNRKHFWSMIDYQIWKHNGFKHVPNWRMKPNKDFIKFLSLDSIEGISRKDWPRKFRRKYSHKRLGIRYSKCVSDTIFLLKSPFNMLGFTVSSSFRDVVIQKGKIKDYLSKSYKRYEEQLGRLKDLAPMMIDGGKKWQITSEILGLNKEVNNRTEALSSNQEMSVYDLLVILCPDGTADVEVLSCRGNIGLEFDNLKKIIREFPKHFFFAYWTIDNKPLPGIYLRGKFEDGLWHFSISPFILGI